MFCRVVKHKTHNKTYKHLQIVESYRDPAKGNSPRIRILYNLGAIEDLGLAQVERLAASLMKAVGMDVVALPEM
ncbi:MAG: hypothetical protein LBB52_06720, partial [Desulfovibrio sp.]|nr:hypothetical protein [Desulfovibrio sp.]